MVNSFFPKFADANALVPLSEIEGANIAEDWEPLFDPAIWGLGERNGEAYGLPFLQSGISFVWNKALFEAAGLDPETPPKTWDELIAVCDALTAAGITPFEATFKEPWTIGQGWFDYAYPNHHGWPGTDMTFSAKCREAGIPLWVDTTTTSPHIGTQLIDERTYRAYIREQVLLAREQQAEAQAAAMVPVGARI